MLIIFRAPGQLVIGRLPALVGEHSRQDVPGAEDWRQESNLRIGWGRVGCEWGEESRHLSVVRAVCRKLVGDFPAPRLLLRL